MEPDDSYPPGGGSQYGLDPRPLNDPPWPPYQGQYGQQAGQFAPQQGSPLGSIPPQTLHQYPNPQLPYGSYGVPQQPSFPAPSYPSSYAPSYQQNNVLPTYVSAGQIQAQSHHQVQQPFPTSNQPYPYAQVFRPDDQTISPHVLERVDNVARPHSNSQTWNQRVTASQGIQNPLSTNVHASQQASLHSRVGENTSPIVGRIGETDRPLATSPHVQRPAPSQRATAILPKTTRVVTHQALLDETKDKSSRKTGLAPFLVLDEEEPVVPERGESMENPISNAAKDTSKQPLATRVENSGTSVSHASSSPKPQPQPIKSTLSAGLAGRASKSKSSTSAQNKSSQPSGSSNRESASYLESTSGKEEVLMENISDVHGKARPTDVVEAAAWDAIGTIFSTEYPTPTKDIVRATVEFAKLLLDLRDDLTTMSTELKNSEAKKRLEDTQRLRDARALKQRVITSAVQAVNKFGKVVILENFGKNAKLIGGLLQILRDCCNSKELEGELPKTVLQLLSRCSYISDEILQKGKFEAIAKRFLQLNDAEMQGFIRSIRDNTIEAKERFEAAKPSTGNEDVREQKSTQEAPKARKAEAPLKPASVSAGLKRSLETDGNSGKPNKKVASEAAAVGSIQKSGTPKPRVASFFDNLKRPGLKSQVASKAANVPAPAKKLDPKPEPTSTPQSSLAEILASIEKPREIPKVPAAPPRAPETPEQKARRERKESRRHLRVRWKDDSSLTEIRLFTHEQAEDEGRQDNMLRDAHDDRSEGMMLKQRVLEDMADEEDDGPGEIEYMPYPELTMTDFSLLGNDMREKSYVTRGGQLPITTPQQETQKQRESLELMVVYTDPKDIPPSPKEPPQTPYEDRSAERAFGQPSAPWLVQRMQEIYQYGTATALSNSVRRLEGQKGKVIYQDAARGVNTAPDISAILKAMKGSPQEQNPVAQQLAYQQLSANQQHGHQNFTSTNKQQESHSRPQLTNNMPQRSEEQMKEANRVFANLERMIDQLRAKPYPPTEPPQWMTESAKFEWWAGWHRDNRTPAKKIIRDEEIAAHQASLRAAETKAAEMKAAEMKAAEMKAAEIKAAEMRAAQTQATQMQSQIGGAQIGSYSIPPLPSMATGSVPSYDIGQLQQILAALSNPGNNSTPPQLQSIFSGLNAQNNQTALPQQPNTWPIGWPGTNGGNSSGQSYPSQSQPIRWESSYTNATDNSRSTYSENSRSTYDTSNQETNNHRARGGGYGGEERQSVPTAASEYKGKKKPCKFWQEGKCAKGANCTFLHD